MVNMIAGARIFLFCFIRQKMIDDNNISDVIIESINIARNLYDFELL